MRLAINYRSVVPSKGGAETYVADLCRRLVGLGHEVDLFAESWDDAVLPPDVRRVRVAAGGPTRAARTWTFARNSEAALRRADHDCAVGFINTWWCDVLIPQGGVHRASLEANARRFPAGWRRSAYVWGKRLNPKWTLYEAIERRQYDPGCSRRFVAVSEMVRGHLERYRGVPRDRIHVIRNAIDAGRLAVPDPAATRRAFRGRHGLAPDAVVGLFAGHNPRLKGLPPLLEALSLRLGRDGSARPVTLLVVGGGDLAPFRRRAERLGLAGSVRFAGFVPDVREAYHASDFFALPTYYDPCSLVVFEALACGLPVITTACNGAGEVITPGREGFVIPEPDAIDFLAGAIDRLADDRDRRTMADHAARLGREQSLERHVDRLVALFGEVATARRRGSPHVRDGANAALRLAPD